MTNTLGGPPGAQLAALLRGRKSIRRYTDRQVPPALVEALADSVRWAPSPHNSQPYRLAILRAATARGRLASALGERWRADLLADGLSLSQVDAMIGRSRERISGAPLVLILALTYSDLDVYPDPRRQQAERLMAAHSLGAAAQNLMLTAHAHGLASCWMCAPLFCPDIVRDALDLPPDLEPQALITVGYPSVDPPHREKRDLGSIIVFDQ